MCVVFLTLRCAFVQITDGSCNGQFIFLVILDDSWKSSVASYADSIALVDLPNGLTIFQLSDTVISVRLNMPVWRDNVKNELKRDTSVETTFYSAVTNDLLGDDFLHRSMSFDVEGRPRCHFFHLRSNFVWLKQQVRIKHINERFHRWVVISVLWWLVA